VLANTQSYAKIERIIIILLIGDIIAPTIQTAVYAILSIDSIQNIGVIAKK
jgi:hypothetical protein